MQSLSNAMNAVKAKANIEQKNQPKPVDPKAKKSFHQNEREKMAADPDNLAYQNARASGKADSAIFMASVMNANDPKHEEAFATFKYSYNMDARQAEEDLVNKVCEARKVAPYEQVDPAYEANVFKKHQPTGNVTRESLAFFDNFKSTMQAKWFERGYSGDKAFVDDYTSKYNLPPNDNKIELRNFQPKQ